MSDKEEVRRLRREVATLRARDREAVESRLGPQDAAGVGGRFAISQLRDADFVQLARLVHSVPDVAADPELGYGEAMGLLRTHVRAGIDSLAFDRTLNRYRARDAHRIHMLLSPGAGDLLLRRDRIGLEARTRLLEAVERRLLSSSFVRLFERSVETPVAPLKMEWRQPE